MRPASGTSAGLARVLVDLVSTSIGRHLLVLLLELLLQLVSPTLVLEDALVEVPPAAAVVGSLVVHDHVVVLAADHLHVVELLVLHDHAGWVILVSSSVVLLSYYELLVVLAAQAVVGLHHLALCCPFSGLLALSLGEFLFALDSWPVDSVTYWLATIAENREGVHPRITAKDLFPVLGVADVVRRLEWLAEFVQVLDRCLVVAGQHDVEFQEGCHQARHDEVEDVAQHHHDFSAELWTAG